MDTCGLMDTELKSPSLVYEICFGAVFKIKIDGRRVTAVSKRDRRGYWLDAQEIEDHSKVYDDLGADQFAIVHVESKDDVVRIRDMFRAALIGDGDTGTIAQAVRQKKLGEILEKAIRDWFKKTGPILNHENGEPTILHPDDLTARYDTKDLQPLRLAFAHEIKEGATAEQMTHLDVAIERFNKFLDKIEPEDELYWFEHLEPLADRIGYCILRKGRVVASYLTMMS
jgi:hypothetical protein